MCQIEYNPWPYGTYILEEDLVRQAKSIKYNKLCLKVISALKKKEEQVRGHSDIMKEGDPWMMILRLY